jgi:ribose transport system substrate-binding protein
MKRTGWMLSVVLSAAVMFAAASCQSSTPPDKAAKVETPAKADLPAATPLPSEVTIGIVAKSQGNPVFQAAHAGAKDAARILGERYGVKVNIDIQTPPDEDAQKQAQAIEQLARAGAKGIAVACSDAAICKTAIDKAVERGAVVMCFDSDSPQSGRFCFYGTDDVTCGEKVMQELAKAMGEKGTIAILGGNVSAPNLHNRIEGVKKELAKHPDIKLLDGGIFYHEETAEKAAQCVNTAQTTHPDIQGWAMVGGWPLFTQNGLKWEPGSVKVVSVDALPPQLQYLKNGYVEALWAQDCYSWGYKSVDILLQKILVGENPKEGTRIIDPLALVTKDGEKGTGKNGADDWAGKWRKWSGKE